MTNGRMNQWTDKRTDILTSRPAAEGPTNHGFCRDEFTNRGDPSTCLVRSGFSSVFDVCCRFDLVSTWPRAVLVVADMVCGRNSVDTNYLMSINNLCEIRIRFVSVGLKVHQQEQLHGGYRAS